jgi:hypothetical protein
MMKQYGRRVGKEIKIYKKDEGEKKEIIYPIISHMLAYCDYGNKYVYS